MASLRIACFAQGIELWESTTDPNAVVSPIGVGSMCVQNSAGTVRFWLCTALPSTWVDLGAAGSGVPLSGIVAATAVNTIDSLALAQTWNWSTATTQAALTLAAAALTSGGLLALVNTSALHTGRVLSLSTNTTAAISNGALRVQGTGAHTGNLVQLESVTTTGNVLAVNASAITTGTICDIVNSSAAVNSTLGLLRVINATATTAGILARFQSNNVAGSGLTILCSGNVGIGIAAPVAALHNAGATVLANTALGNFAGGGVIGTAAATVDAFSSATIAQTTGAQVLSIPAPTNATAGRLFRVSNNGPQTFTILGVVLTTAATPATAGLTAMWDGTAWVRT